MSKKPRKTSNRKASPEKGYVILSETDGFFWNNIHQTLASAKKDVENDGDTYSNYVIYGISVVSSSRKVPDRHWDDVR